MDKCKLDPNKVGVGHIVYIPTWFDNWMEVDQFVDAV